MQTVLDPGLKLKVHSPETKDEWLALRQKHITATDWPKIKGTSRFGNARDVLMDKLGMGKVVEETVHMRVGKLLEPLVVETIMEEVHQTQQVNELNILFRDPMFVASGVLGCTPDLTLVVRGEIDHTEIKVSGSAWNEAPAGYVDQTKFQMALLGIMSGQIRQVVLKETWEEAEAQLLAGTYVIEANQITDWPVELDPGEGEQIMLEAEEWWNTHIELELPLVEEEARPNWKGKVEDADAALGLRRALAAAKAAKDQLEAVTTKVEEYKAKALAKLGQAKSLVGEGFSIDRAWVKGRQTTDYAAILRGLEKTLNEAQKAKLVQLTALATATTSGYIRWSVKE